MDWLSALDLEHALHNVTNDIVGDWYRDPWGWCELRWLVPDHLETYVVPRLNASGVKTTVRLDVPKENFAVRPAVVLDPVDRLIYQSLVDRLSVRLVGDLAPWAYGWRMIRAQPKDGVWARNDYESKAFRRHLKALASVYEAALSTDIVSFFASIPVQPLIEQILERGQNEPARRLADMVEAWYGRVKRGLPQRSAASAALAHMYLKPLDDVLAQYNAITSRFLSRIVRNGRSLRWMDDMWVFSRDGVELRETQLAIHSGLRSLGLELNVGKTTVLQDDDLISAVFEIEHSAADQGLEQEHPDETALNAVIDRLVAAPEVAPRTSIRFATQRMRAWEIYQRAPEFGECAERMPHGADHLARLFRASEVWRDLQEWYASYSARWAARLPWSVGQLGTMFPSDTVADKEVCEVFAEALGAAGTPLPLLAVAAQRLAAWHPDDARVLCRQGSESEGEPLRRRILALASLHAGETRSVVRPMLTEHEENAPVLAMLEDRNFKPSAVPIVSDFG